MREKCRLRVFAKRVLRMIYGLKKDKVNWGLKETM